jgi:hypothetical protein
MPLRATTSAAAAPARVSIGADADEMVRDSSAGERRGADAADVDVRDASDNDDDVGDVIIPSSRRSSTDAA